MKIRFLGAAGDVTGSAYHVMTNQASILVDCGFFQGKKEESQKNRRAKQIEGSRPCARGRGRTVLRPWQTTTGGRAS